MSFVKCPACGAMNPVDGSAANLLCGACQTALPTQPPIANVSGPAPPHLSGAAPPQPTSAGNPLPPHLAGGGAAQTPPQPAAEPAETPKRRRKLSAGTGKSAWLATLLFAMFGFVIFASLIGVLIINRPELFVAGAGNQPTTDGGRKIIRLTTNMTPTWSDASKYSLRRNRVKVRIDRVEVGQVRVKNAAGQVMITDDSNYIMITINVFNHAPKPVEYQSWYGNSFRNRRGSNEAELTNNSGHLYQPAIFPEAANVRDHTAEATIGPLEEVTDVLIFEAPADFRASQVRYLRLSLPAEAYHEVGDYRFEIPSSFIKDSPKSQPLGDLGGYQGG